MSRSIRVLTAFVAVLVVPGIAVPPVAAQFGALTKKVKQVTEEAVEERLPFTPQAAPEFSDRVLEIDAARLDQLLEGFKAEASHARTAKKEYEDQLKNAEALNAAYEKERAAYDQTAVTYQACSDRFREGELKAEAATEAEMEQVLAEMSTAEFERYIENLALRGEVFAKRAAAGTLDPATDRAWQAYAREMLILQREQERRAKRILAGMDATLERNRTANPRLIAACGQAPIPPSRPYGSANSPEAVLLRHGAEAASLEGSDPSPTAKLERYTIMRERVFNWIAEKGRPSKMGFSTAEVSVLQAAAARLSEAEKNLKKAGVPI